MTATTKEMTVTKAFRNLSEAEVNKILADGYGIDMKVGKGVYLYLKPENTESTKGQYVYTGSYDAATKTYTCVWTVRVLNGEHYVIQEKGYAYDTNNYNVTAFSTLNNQPDTQRSGDTAGLAGNVTDKKYDVVGGPTRTVAFTNLYSPMETATLTIMKTNADTNLTMQGVHFTLTPIDGDGGATGDASEVITNANGYASFTGLRAGTRYRLEEKLTMSYFKPNTNTMIVDVTKTADSTIPTITVTETPENGGESKTYTSSDGNPVLLYTVKNYLSSTTAVITKNFENITSDEIKKILNGNGNSGNCYRIVVRAENGTVKTTLTAASAVRISSDCKQLIWYVGGLAEGEHYSLTEEHYQSYSTAYENVTVSAEQSTLMRNQSGLEVIVAGKGEAKTASVIVEKGAEHEWISITNSYSNTYDLRLRKVDSVTGDPVKGAKFQIWYGSNHTDTGELNDLGTYFSDASGKIILPEIKDGWYKVTELEPASGYAIKEPATQECFISGGESKVLTFENTPLSAIIIRKVDSESGQPLEGAWFRIRYLGGTSGTGGTVIGEYRTSSNGTIVVTGLKAGTYVCEEISAPDGYVITDAAETVYLSGKDQDVITVTFGNDKMGSLLIVKKDAVTGAPISDVEFFITDSDGSVIGTANGRYVTDSAGTIRIDGLTPGMTVIAREVRAKGGYILDDTPQSIKIKRNAVMTLEFRNQPRGGVLVKKVDAVTNAPISDVEFLVTDSDGNLIGNANGKFVTDSAGTFTITDVAPGTTLIIKETRAKAGYILDDTPQTVKVKSNEVVTVEFRNAPKGNLIIVKQDSVTKAPLEGVQFKIAYADGSYVDAEGGTLSSTGLYWTDKEGKITISGISGTVVVTEIETIPGYSIDENARTQTVVVNPNDTQTLYFYNTPVGGLQIIKSDKDSGKRISGVKFEIRKMNGEIIGTYTTDSDGVIYLPEAESGWYTVTEQEAASGYLLDTTPHRIEVKDGQTATLEITNHKSSRILLHKVDKATGKGIYGAVFLLYDSNHNPIGEYVTDQDGYIYADEGLADGRYYLREIKAAPGYVLDPELKTIYVRYGSTTEIEWSNTAECGQIQVIKKSANDNPINGLPAGTLLEGAVFEIYDKAGNVVDTIKSDRNGRAISKTLPLSRYTIREIKAPANYSINPTVMNAYLEFNGQIVTFEVQNTSVATGVSIKKTGPVQAVPGQPIRYVFSQIKNSSNVALDSFYWRDQLPAQVTLSKIVTGSYNQPLSYKVVYKTNLSGDYRTLADNLSTSKVYVLDARPAVLGLAANEHVTEVMFVFGNVKAGFAQVETPYIYATARSGLANNASVVNVADVGGLYNGQWIQAVSRWLTTVYTKTTVRLPKTGY